MGTNHSSESGPNPDKPSGGDTGFEFDPDRAFAEIRAEQDGQEKLPIPEPVEASADDVSELKMNLPLEGTNHLEFADTTPPVIPASSTTEQVTSEASHVVVTRESETPRSASSHSTVSMSDDDLQAASHEDFETLKDPRIPTNKQFFKIGEVSRITGLKPYVLRYWETEFSWVKPTKTSSRQRMYRRSDVVMLLKIKRLRYQEHHTIASAREEIRKSRKQERKNTRSGTSTRAAPRKGTHSESTVLNAPALVGAPAYASAGNSPQLGLGFPTAPRAAELARRLSEMRRSVLEMIETVKE